MKIVIGQVILLLLMWMMTNSDVAGYSAAAVVNERRIARFINLVCPGVKQ